MRIPIAFLFIAVTNFAAAEITFIGGVHTRGTLPSSEATTLVASIVRVGPIACTRVIIHRKGDAPGTLRQLDVWQIAAGFADDPPLQEGDAVVVPQHVIGCVDPEKLHQFLQRYLIEKKKSSSAPHDWPVISEASRGSHSPQPEKKEANQALQTTRVAPVQVREASQQSAHHPPGV